MKVYDKYLFILKEKAKIEQLLNAGPYKRETFTKEILRYEETIRDIRNNMPYEIRMNMFLIDCVDLNNKLVSELEELIDRILTKVSEFVFTESSASIIASVKAINESFAAKADTSKKLVSMEKELEEIKVIRKQKIVDDYNDLVEWLMMLYNNPRFRVQEDSTRSVNSAYLQTCKISQMIEMQENRLKQDRTDIETALERQKSEFKEMIIEIKTDVDKFKDYDNKRNRDDYNKQIVNINLKL